MKKITIIAEAGVNHNGDLNLAKKLVQEAAYAGADYVKFQSFDTEDIVTKDAKQASYQEKNTKTKQSQYDMLKKLELDKRAHIELIKECEKCGINFLSTAFDLKNIELLNELGLEIFKIPSGEITNLPYLKAIAKLNKKVFMSTGMSNLAQIQEALDILYKYGTKRKNITLLHCNTQYPTPFEDANLKAMLTLKEAFKLDVGYSDHTQGISVALGAAALGALVIEKHFTLDKSMQGPDHKASLEPCELRAMIKGIREIEMALGDGIKRISKSEKENAKIARKSLVALKDIKKGELLSEENLGTKRPAHGISAIRYDEYIGKKALKNYKKDEFI